MPTFTKDKDRVIVVLDHKEAKAMTLIMRHGMSSLIKSMDAMTKPRAVRKETAALHRKSWNLAKLFEGFLKSDYKFNQPELRDDMTLDVNFDWLTDGEIEFINPLEPNVVGASET